ncbi:MAG: prepilin-type N-terminal cleavage/methylation domain-containing protein [Defluviitaleaceae bacterium]|nr:prepilin-type N-terminal cleavage/methylation domain-containing protein [Defluviitaleaceae bacterium]
MKINKRKLIRRGMSLVEIVAVMAVIAIIGLAAIARFSTPNEITRVTALESSFSTLISAMGMHAANNSGELPTLLSEIEPFMDLRGHADINALFDAIGGSLHNVTVAIDPSDSAITVTMNNLSVDHNERMGIMTVLPPNGVYTLTFNPAN